MDTVSARVAYMSLKVKEGRIIHEVLVSIESPYIFPAEVYEVLAVPGVDFKAGLETQILKKWNDSIEDRAPQATKVELTECLLYGSVISSEVQEAV